MRKGAFTLIELLVVIAIIAILAAILFPVFANAKSAAKQSTCLSNIKQLTLGVMLYQNDYDDGYPIGGWQDPEGTTNPTFSTRWYIDIAPYTKNIQIRNCPSNRYQIAQSDNWSSDYGINVSLSGWTSAENASAISQPANLLMTCDTAQLDYSQFPSSADNQDPAAWEKHAVAPTDYQVEGPYIFYPYTDYPYTDPTATYGDNYRRPYAIHNGRLNVGFCDGHAHSQDIRALIGPMPTGYALTDARNVWANP